MKKLLTILVAMLIATSVFADEIDNYDELYFRIEMDDELKAVRESEEWIESLQKIWSMYIHYEKPADYETVKQLLLNPTDFSLEEVDNA